MKAQFPHIFVFSRIFPHDFRMFFHLCQPHPPPCSGESASIYWEEKERQKFNRSMIHFATELSVPQQSSRKCPTFEHLFLFIISLGVETNFLRFFRDMVFAAHRAPATGPRQGLLRALSSVLVSPVTGVAFGHVILADLLTSYSKVPTNPPSSSPLALDWGHVRLGRFYFPPRMFASCSTNRVYLSFFYILFENLRIPLAFSAYQVIIRCVGRWIFRAIYWF